MTTSTDSHKRVTERDAFGRPIGGSGGSAPSNPSKIPERQRSGYYEAGYDKKDIISTPKSSFQTAKAGYENVKLTSAGGTDMSAYAHWQAQRAQEPYGGRMGEQIYSGREQHKRNIARMLSDDLEGESYVTFSDGDRRVVNRASEKESYRVRAGGEDVKFITESPKTGERVNRPEERRVVGIERGNKQIALAYPESKTSVIKKLEHDAYLKRAGFFNEDNKKDSIKLIPKFADGSSKEPKQKPSISLIPSFTEGKKPKKAQLRKPSTKPAAISLGELVISYYQDGRLYTESEIGVSGVSALQAQKQAESYFSKKPEKKTALEMTVNELAIATFMGMEFQPKEHMVVTTERKKPFLFPKAVEEKNPLAVAKASVFPTDISAVESDKTEKERIIETLTHGDYIKMQREYGGIPNESVVYSYAKNKLIKREGKARQAGVFVGALGAAGGGVGGGLAGLGVGGAGGAVVGGVYGAAKGGVIGYTSGYYGTKIGQQTGDIADYGVSRLPKQIKEPAVMGVEGIPIYFGQRYAVPAIKRSLEKTTSGDFNPEGLNFQDYMRSEAQEFIVGAPTSPEERIQSTTEFTGSLVAISGIHSKLGQGVSLVEGKVMGVARGKYPSLGQPIKLKTRTFETKGWDFQSKRNPKIIGSKYKGLVLEQDAPSGAASHLSEKYNRALLGFLDKKPVVGNIQAVPANTNYGLQVARFMPMRGQGLSVTPRIESEYMRYGLQTRRLVGAQKVPSKYYRGDVSVAHQPKVLEKPFDEYVRSHDVLIYGSKGSQMQGVDLTPKDIDLKVGADKILTFGHVRSKEQVARDLYNMARSHGVNNVRINPEKTGLVQIQEGGSWKNLYDIHSMDEIGETGISLKDSYLAWGMKETGKYQMIDGKMVRELSQEANAKWAASSIPMNRQFGIPQTPSESRIVLSGMEKYYYPRGYKLGTESHRIKDIGHYGLIEQKLIDYGVESGRNMASAQSSLDKLKITADIKFSGQAGYTPFSQQDKILVGSEKAFQSLYNIGSSASSSLMKPIAFSSIPSYSIPKRSPSMFTSTLVAPEIPSYSPSKISKDVRPSGSVSGSFSPSASLSPYISPSSSYYMRPSPSSPSQSPKISRSPSIYIGYSVYSPPSSPARPRTSTLMTPSASVNVDYGRGGLGGLPFMWGGSGGKTYTRRRRSSSRIQKNPLATVDQLLGVPARKKSRRKKSRRRKKK